MKKFSNLLFILTISLLLNGCNVSQEEYDDLNNKYIKLVNESTELFNENKKLKQELEELKNEEIRIIGRIDKYIKQKKYSNAIKNINTLYEKFPESKKNKIYQKQLSSLKKKLKIQKDNIIKKKKAEQKKLEKERKKREQIANINKSNIWTIRHYVDEFGDKTKVKYITNKAKIVGSFSNVATQNSKLYADLLINSSNDISILLYEYGGNNPVKGYSYKDEYLVYIQDNNKKKYELTGSNYSDRLSLSTESSKKLHKALSKGGTIKFRIVEKKRQTTQYAFNILNSKYYTNAYRILKKGK